MFCEGKRSGLVDRGRGVREGRREGKAGREGEVRTGVEKKVGINTRQQEQKVVEYPKKWVGFEQ